MFDIQEISLVVKSFVLAYTKVHSTLYYNLISPAFHIENKCKKILQNIEINIVVNKQIWFTSLKKKAVKMK